MSDASVVVDTNVALVANAALEPESPWGVACIQACVDALAAVQRGRRIILDDTDAIVTEYFRKLNRHGMPGVGDQFAKWAWDHRFVPDRCSLVTITVDGATFEEFPDDPRLRAFDPSDHKFIAAACGHGPNHELLQAVDSKWWGMREELAEAGVNVVFVCPENIASLHGRKQKRNRKRK